MAQPAPGIAPEAALLLLAVSWSAVIVLVPANCPTKTFGAYVTVALDAVSYYASGEIPKGDPVTGDEPVIDQILAVEGNHFLGTFPNVDHTKVRWLFYVEAHGDDPVVVNVKAGLRSANQFTTTYWTAVDAVRWYIEAKQAEAKQQKLRTILLILMVMASNAHAQIGWTLDQCRKHWGRENSIKHYYLDESHTTTSTTYIFDSKIRKEVTSDQQGKVNDVHYIGPPEGAGLLKIAKLLEREEGVIWLVDADQGQSYRHAYWIGTRTASLYSTLVTFLESAM